MEWLSLLLHRKGYIPILSTKTVEELEDKDVIRKVKNYDPDTEVVIVLIKSQERTSIYQIQLQKFVNF
jgi:hypothetical protein